jgi:hypothetical protein
MRDRLLGTDTGFPAWFRAAIGATELACALALFIPRSRRWACAVLPVVMAGAAVTHLTHGEPRRVVLNVGLSALIGLLMRLGQKPSTSPTPARQTFETISRTRHPSDEEEEL